MIVAIVPKTKTPEIASGARGMKRVKDNSSQWKIGVVNPLCSRMMVKMYGE